MFMNILEATCSESHVLDHPFLTQFAAGAFSREQLAEWVGQQTHLSRSLPHCMAAVAARLPFDFVGEHRALVENVYRETWSASDTKGHQHLLATLWRALRSDPLDPTKLPAPLPATDAFVAGRLLLTNGDTPLPMSLGAMAASEWLNADASGQRGIMVAYQAGLERAELPTDYATAHVRDEPHDAALFTTIAERLLREHNDHNQLGEFRAGVQCYCTLRLVWFQGLMAHLAT